MNLKVVMFIPRIKISMLFNLKIIGERFRDNSLKMFRNFSDRLHRLHRASALGDLGRPGVSGRGRDPGGVGGEPRVLVQVGQERSKVALVFHVGHQGRRRARIRIALLM